jgi:hypothetical protein
MLSYDSPIDIERCQQHRKGEKIMQRLRQAYSLLAKPRVIAGERADLVCSRTALKHTEATESQEAGPGPGSESDDIFHQLYRRHNSSLPDLKGQVIGARIFRTDRRFVYLDTGYNKPVKFAKKQLHLSQLLASRDGGLRMSPDDFRVGDVLRFVIEEVETPYGDMQLAVDQPIAGNKIQGVWELLKDAMETNQPVMGRVLNAVNGGYSVGIAGLVAFCPYSSISFATASKIGVLQPFYVYSMTEAKRNVVLQDASQAPRRGGLPAG